MEAIRHFLASDGLPSLEGLMSYPLTYQEAIMFVFICFYMCILYMHKTHIDHNPALLWFSWLLVGVVSLWSSPC